MRCHGSVLERRDSSMRTETSAADLILACKRVVDLVCTALHVRRQLGIELHALGSALPLYDGVTGAPVPPDTDARIERVRPLADS